MVGCPMNVLSLFIGPKHGFMRERALLLRSGIFSATNGQALSHPKGLSGLRPKPVALRNLLAEYGANGLGAVSGG